MTADIGWCFMHVEIGKEFFYRVLHNNLQSQIFINVFGTVWTSDAATSENSSQASRADSNVFGSFDNGLPDASDTLYLCSTY